jgi:uncharacterized protein YkwD
MTRPFAAPLLLLALAGPAPAEDTPAEVKLSADEKALLLLLNQERKKEKLPELAVNALLCKAARLHAQNMARQEKCEHELDGKRVAGRVTDAGYDYRVVRENLAMAAAEREGDDPPAPAPAEVHRKWMESKGHRANILFPRCTEVGLAIARSKKGTYYYAQVFASPRR